MMNDVRVCSLPELIRVLNLLQLVVIITLSPMYRWRRD